MLKPFSNAHLDRTHKYRVPSFQCQLKLESVTFFSVSRFLLCNEMCVGAAHKGSQDQALPCERRAQNEAHSQKKEWQFQDLAFWLLM